MKSILLSILVILSGATLGAAAPASNIPSDIKSVIVYRTGAQVSRAGESTVPAGQSILKISGLSAYLIPSSIQFSATGDFTILSVNFQRNFINPLESSEEAKTLKERIEGLEQQIGRRQIDIQVLKEEEALLLANKQIGGQQEGVRLQDLQDIAAYYRERLKAIKVEQYEIELEGKQLQEELEKLQRQLDEMSARLGQKASGEVWITVSAETAVSTRFQLDYMVPNAGWSPAYDVRVNDIGEDVRLNLKGDVFQSSGEEWAGVSLSLSTGIPTESGVKPDLQPWWLAPYQPVAFYSGSDKKLRERDLNQSMSTEGMADMEMEDAPAAPAPSASYVSVEQFERTTTREYRITLPYDIPSDGKPYTVAIEQYELPAIYEYYVAPKLNVDAFLTAKVSGWDEHQLLSGPANLFFEGSYMGRTQLDVQQTSDTLLLSLGRDKGIVVSRTKDEQYKDKQFIGNKQTQITGWKIELRNSKTKAVRILVEDQYPVSTTDEIEVDLKNAGGATVEKESGKMTWQVDLVPGSSKELRFQYEVKYPKRMDVILE